MTRNPLPPFPHGHGLLTTSRTCLAGAALCLLLAWPAHAGDRLTATGGISDVEGAGGGGLTPWALITGNGADDQIGGSVHATRLDTGDFKLDTAGVSVGIDDRLELSLSRLTLDLGTTVPGDAIREDVAGIKLRLAGDAVFEPDRLMPQIAVGVEYKHNLDAAPVPRAIGARRDADFDFYLSATKLWFNAVGGRNVLSSLTLRATRANQLGLLGFGGDRGDAREIEAEGSLAVFLRDDLVAGGEFRRKPNLLSAFREDTFYDLFVAWFPRKAVSLTGAYTRLGTIADKHDQRGWLFQLQLNQ